MMNTTAPKTSPAPSRWVTGLQQAIEQGIIGPSYSLEEHTPWSTMVLTFIGAFISSLLFIACFGLIAYELDLIDSSVFFFICGFLGTVSALVTLHSKSQRRLFAEYLLFILLVVGIGLITVGFLVDSPIREKQVPLLISILCGICTFALPINWGRAIGGFATAMWLYLYFQVFPSAIGFPQSYVAVLTLPLVAMVFIAAQQSIVRQGRWKLALHLEPILCGWVAATLIAVAISAGQAMFVGGFLPTSFGATSGKTAFGSLLVEYMRYPLTWISLATLPIAWWWSGMHWKVLQHGRVIALLLVVTVFSCISPLLAISLALGTMALATQRYRIAILAGIAALWIIGALYYNLHMTLAHKAAWLAITGLVLLVLAFAGRPLKQPAAQTPSPAAQSKTMPFATKPVVSLALLALAAVVAFGGVNSSIWKQEQIRSADFQVLIPLAPVDPRSLMQGDYMVVNFEIGSALANAPEQARRYAYLDIGPDHVARLHREAHEGEPRIELVYRSGRWTLPADAWFFQEGDGKRWEAARYGIFTVTPDGQSALVNMATSDLQPIQ
ncbi:GDYXXLXY domain-containing protein [Saezia sanguinis]|uniref:GDYXXLXY domain-containing protein n=1 Tax=Saezia sanguinis TaxID=1965230 RepID=UPI00303293EE